MSFINSMDKWWLPYLLPVVTLIVVGVLVFSNEEVTGLAVFQEEELEVKINLHRGIVVPPDTLIQVSLDDEVVQLTLQEFIQKTGQDYAFVFGSYKEINYLGPGFTGPFEYKLRLSDLDLGEEGLMKIVITYNGFEIWRDERNVGLSSWKT